MLYTMMIMKMMMMIMMMIIKMTTMMMMMIIILIISRKMHGRLTLLFKILIRNRFNTNTDYCKWNSHIYNYTANHINVFADGCGKDPKSVRIPMNVLPSTPVLVLRWLSFSASWWQYGVSWSVFKTGYVFFVSITSSAFLSAVHFCPNISVRLLI